MRSLLELSVYRNGFLFWKASKFLELETSNDPSGMRYVQSPTVCMGFESTVFSLSNFWTNFPTRYAYASANFLLAFYLFFYILTARSVY